MELLRSFLRCYFPDGPLVPSQTVGCFLRLADWGNVSMQTSFNGKRKGFLLVRCCTSKASIGRFHFVVQRSRTRTIMKGQKNVKFFFSFKLSLYRWFCFPKNQIQNKRNYQVLSPTVEPQYNEGPRDWQTLFAITRFRYIEVLFHVFCYYWGKDNRSLYWGLYMEVRYIEVPL